jgi:hypothetical protein
VNDLGAISFPLDREGQRSRALAATGRAERIADELTRGKFVVNPEVQVSLAR